MVSDQLCQKCFVKFCIGDDFSLNDALWLARPVVVDNDQMKTLLENSQKTYSEYPDPTLNIICIILDKSTFDV